MLEGIDSMISWVLKCQMEFHLEKFEGTISEEKIRQMGKYDVQKEGAFGVYIHRILWGAGQDKTLLRCVSLLVKP